MSQYCLEAWPEWLDAFLAQALPQEDWQSVLASLTPEKTPPDLVFAIWQHMRAQAQMFPECSLPLMDCCGTGGSGQAHYNTSTTVAFILAAGGVPVVKFGNKAISSQSGSFDFLEAIGVAAAPTPEAAMEELHTLGLTFLFAPQVYPALASLQAARKQVPHPTIFNMLGPLLHPLQPAFRLMGVAKRWPLESLALILKNKQAQVQRALLVQSKSGLDELEPHLGASGLWFERSTENVISTEPWHWQPETPVQIVTSEQTFTPASNATFFFELLENAVDTQNVTYKQVCLNAGLAFQVYGLSTNLAQGYILAERLLKEGHVKRLWQAIKKENA